MVPPLRRKSSFGQACCEQFASVVGSGRAACSSTRGRSRRCLASVPQALGLIGGCVQKRSFVHDIEPRPRGSCSRSCKPYPLCGNDRHCATRRRPTSGPREVTVRQAAEPAATSASGVRRSESTKWVQRGDQPKGRTEQGATANRDRVRACIDSIRGVAAFLATCVRRRQDVAVLDPLADRVRSLMCVQATADYQERSR
jgi:hypothetical protein